MSGDAGGEDTEGDATADEADAPSTDGAVPTTRSGARDRDVVVPLPVYKVVTVFSTLIAVVFVVGGFLALDAATRRATAPPEAVDPWLALVGLLAIAAGGLVYAFASRFRAPGMGTPKPDDDETADDG